MTPTPACLSALGLDASAGPREVRRAYASRLKAIDHEQDPEAFHALRAEYEAALRWVVTRDQAADERAVASDGPGPGPDADLGPRDEVPDVFHEFIARLPTLNAEEVSTALEAALRDPRMEALNAGARFEFAVAHRLAQGWQPGHQYLLPSAVQVFDWGDDYRWIERLGDLGYWLDAALMQAVALSERPRRVVEDYDILLARLRDPKDPPRRLLVEEMPKLRILLAHFPQWLQASTSMDNVQRWLTLFDTLPEAAWLRDQQTVPTPPPTAAESSSSGNPFGWLLAGGLILFKLYTLLF